MNISQKLTSRKFWMAVAAFVVGVLALFNVDANTTQQISGVIMSLGSVIAYIVGEGLVDSASAQAGLRTADIILDGVQVALPGLPGVAVVDKVVELAEKSVNAAEQMNKSNQISADQRKATAVQLVKDYLTAANVEITPDMEKIIDGAVEAAVFVLPKTNAA